MFLQNNHILPGFLSKLVGVGSPNRFLFLVVVRESCGDSGCCSAVDVSPEASS